MRLSIAVAATLLTAGFISAAEPATAAPSAGMDASEVVGQLQEEGYAVQLNGPTGIPLSQCTVTDVHGVPAHAGAAVGSGLFTTVYVDINCQAEG